ncbi:MAG: hypothetical protein FWC27_03530, partial [Firmicutes bacterium]|nr:hypothetical protein [Bacillota bacterium]
ERTGLRHGPGYPEYARPMVRIGQSADKILLAFAARLWYTSYRYIERATAAACFRQAGNSGRFALGGARAVGGKKISPFKKVLDKRCSP